MQLSPIVDHAYLLNVTPDQHHARDHKARHQKDGADDLESLLCLANFSEKSHASLTNVTANQHHAQAHTLASHSTKAHTELTDVLSSQHHARYTDAEAVAATSTGPLTGLDFAIAGTPHAYIRTTALSSQDAILSIRGARTSSITSDIAQILLEDNSEEGRALAKITIRKQSADTDEGNLILWTNKGDNTFNQSMRFDKDGNTIIPTGKTVDGVDISAHAANVSAHHTKFTITEHDTTTRHSLGSVVPHDALASLTEKAHGSLTGVTADQHHPQAHTLASHTTKAHGELTGVTTAQHHAKYTNPEAVSAVEAVATLNMSGNIHAVGYIVGGTSVLPNGGDFDIAPGRWLTFWNPSFGEGYIHNNLYYSAGWKYRYDGAATYLNVGAGAFRVKMVASGVAGDVATLIPSIDVDTLGNVGLGQNLNMVAGKTVDGVDVSTHAANADAHHTKFTITEHDTTARHPVAVIKTSQGSVAGTYAHLVGGNITFNRKSFFPQLASDNELWVLTALAGADPNDYIGRLALWNDSGAAVDYWLKWDYLS